MDGYAIVADDTATATGRRPGAARRHRRGGGRRRAGCRRPTGHRACGSRPARPSRPGADAVVPVEFDDAARRRRQSRPDRAAVTPRGRVPAAILVHEAVRPGEIDPPPRQRPRRRRPILERGDEMTPPAIAIAAGAGVTSVEVHRRPRIAVLATGDEVRGPGEAARAGRDPRRERTRAAGARPRVRRRAHRPRHREGPAGRRPRSRLERGVAEADAIIVSGGVSVGPYDVVKLELRGGRHRRPLAGRGPAGQALRLRARAATAAPAPRTSRPRAPVRPAGQPRVVVRDVRAVRAAGAPAAGRLPRGCFGPSTAAVLEEPVTKGTGPARVPARPGQRAPTTAA